MSPTAAEAAPATTAETRPQPGPWDAARRVLKPLASLRLTVVLFSLSMVLVFLGTVAQIRQGIWTVVDQYFWSWVVWVPFDVFAEFLNVFFRPDGASWRYRFPGSFPFPAGKALALALCANLVAAHVLRFRITWKRSGILLIHAGLLLMLAGEVITREAAVEQQMGIEEGGAANYAEEMRTAELVFVRPAADGTEDVVGVNQKRLARGGRIEHPDLPFDVEVLEFMANSAMQKSSEAKRENPATDGAGKDWVAEPRNEVEGVASDQKFDMPAAYVRLYKKGAGEAAGTYLVSMTLGLNEHYDPVAAPDGTVYKLALRPRRHYKPYSIQLLDFRFDRYVGTDKPKNYSSQVRVIDPERGVDREYLISMNNPLRYRGEAFFQSSFDPRTERTTFLQVVKNPGWTLPYVSCVVVGWGMLDHFMILLLGFRLKDPKQAAAWQKVFLLGSLAGKLVVGGIMLWLYLGVAG